MEKTHRYLRAAILEELRIANKMIFISGPRQVGKTTLAKSLLNSPINYHSYDTESFRRLWAKGAGLAIEDRAPGVLVLDEIHKDRMWKRKLKGIYDEDAEDLKIIVTGSARLDLFRRGSDSLLGRYLPFRLHPMSVGESPSSPNRELRPARLEDLPESFLGSFLGKKGVIAHPLDALLKCGGFPEPLLLGSEARALRWSRLRLERLIQEDTRDFLNISDLRAFQVLVELLPERVCSPLSINALREDVGKAYATVNSWYQVLESLYYSFTIRPYYKKVTRAIRSEPKLFLYDILQIPKENEAKRLENLTALHLLKACHYWTDTAKGDFSLHYVRDKEKREVDFLVVKDRKPWLLVECKSGQTEPCANLKYFAKILEPAYCVQLVTRKGYDREFAAFNTRVLSYEKFFAKLP